MTTAPTRQPQPEQPHVTDYEPKCWKCGRTLAGYMTRPWSKKCPRCGEDNQKD